MPNKIVFNGQEYDSIDAMPPDIRAAYQTVVEAFADTNHNGIPDVFEGGAATSHVRVVTQVNITINGQTYHSPDEMPPDVRRIYTQAAQNGVLTGIPAAVPGPAPDGELHFAPPLIPRAEEPHRAQDPTLRLRFIAILVIFIIVLFVAIAAVWLSRSSIFR
jgi:hypothetical protein